MKIRKASAMDTSTDIFVNVCASMAGLAVLATAGCATHVPGDVATTIYGPPVADMAG